MNDENFLSVNLYEVRYHVHCSCSLVAQMKSKHVLRGYPQILGQKFFVTVILVELGKTITIIDISSYHEKATKRCTSSLRSCQPSVYHTKMGEFH